MRTLAHDLGLIWHGLRLPLRISAILAGLTALILLAVALLGPTSMRLGAAIGLVALLITMQATVLLLLISGQLIPTPRTERQLAVKALGLLRAGDFAAAAAMYQVAEAAGIPASAIGALHGLAAYFNGDMTDAASIVRESMRVLSPDPARTWLTAGLCIICLIPPPGSTSEQTLYDILGANPAGRVAWQSEAERFQATPYGQQLHDLLRRLDTGRAVRD